MARILGLDLGSYSVKAVVLDAAFRGVAVKRFTEVRLAGANRQEALEAALDQLAADRGLAADQVAVAVPGAAVATQILSLPFANQRQVEQTLGFEVEGQMLFDLEDIVFDYQLLAAQTAGKTDLLVGAVKKDDLHALLGLLRKHGVDPRVITLPALALQGLLAGAAGAPGDAHAVVDLGHERVSVLIGTSEGCELARTFAGGGHDLTRALAADFKVGLEEAQAWKEQHADLTERPRTADEEAAVAAIVRGLQPVVRELRQTFRAHQARFRRPVGRVLLCGGTARLRGLPALLSRDLGLEVALLPAPPDLAAAVRAEELPRSAQAYALAQRATGSAKGVRFNLRRGELAFKGDFEYLKGKTSRLAVFGAVLLALAGSNAFARLHSLSTREQRLDDKLCAMTERVLKRCERDYTVALSMLRGHGAAAEGLPKVSAVELLAETINRIPADAKAKITDVEIGLGRMRVRGTVGSFDAVDLMTSSLKTYRCFSTINRNKLEKDAKDPTRVSFTLNIEIACDPPATASQG